MKAIINNRLLSTIRPAEKPFEVRDKKVTGFILRVQPTGRMTYICQYARGRRINIGHAAILTPVQARDRAKEILADALKGIDPRASRNQAKVYTLESYLKTAYGPWAESHLKDGRGAVARIRACFKELLPTKLDDLSPWLIEKWRSGRLKAGIRPATVNRDVSTLKAALTKAVQWGFLKSDPLASVKTTRVDNARVRFLSDEEEAGLRSALDRREVRISDKRESANAWRRERGYKEFPDIGVFADHLKPLAILTINTGIRRGEGFSLQWPDVDLERPSLEVRGQNTKNSKTRHIPLNDEALAVLKAWKEQSHSTNYVFPAANGNRLSTIKTAWNAVLKDAQITDFTWHDLRHHFASRLVMAGVDLNTVRELLGHGDLKMTLRYAHLAPAVKAAAVEKLVRDETWQKRVSEKSKHQMPIS